MLGVIMEGRGVIFVTSHYSSFELPAQLLACLGFDVSAVMRPLDNEHLNRFIVNSRRTHGLALLDKKGAMSQAEDLLRRGSLLALVGDQDAGRKGMFVDFFGRPASTYKSIGLLAMSTGCPIVVGYARRHGHRPRYDVGVERIIRPHEWEGQADALRWITQEYTTAIEAVVRREPEQYLWIHRRRRIVGGARRILAQSSEITEVGAGVVFMVDREATSRPDVIRHRSHTR
jgi:KDO2-lipid IV(A) lauroyltransferase